MPKKTFFYLKGVFTEESPIVHFLWSGQIECFLLLFGAVCFHTAIFASQPEIVNKTTRVPREEVTIHWTEILTQGKQEVQKQANRGDLS